jgi:hypothetical protein
MDTIAKNLLSSGHSALVAQLQKQIARYEFEEGQETLRSLAGALHIDLPA